MKTTLGQPIIDKAMKGINSALITYGASNAGKTYNLLGVGSLSGGLVKNIIQDLYNAINSRTSATSSFLFDRNESLNKDDYTISLQAVEVHMDQVNDLFMPKSSKTNLKIR